MKKLLFTTSFILLVAFGGISAFAQCSPATESLIKCGYYNEGYQDGIADAQSNRSNDYRRYRDKFERQYENNYNRGYIAGYESVRPAGNRWTNSQRAAYDAGYTIGENDRRRGGENRSAESRSSAQYDQNIGLYFQQGYFDAFNNRGRQYDVPLGENPQYPPNPGANGTATWNGRVDDRANLTIHGGTITLQNVSGEGAQTTYQNMNGSLPHRATVFTARKTEGRGDVTVIQQPNRSNDFTAIVQIYDRRGGTDNYGVEMSWNGAGNNVEEPYRAGSIAWSGRVDGTVNITISGADVQSTDMTGNGMYNVDFQLNGYLAHRPGTITATKRKGSGRVTVIQQPSRDNDYTAIVQVYDPNRGADDYRVDIRW